jgi:hypothetical protein
MEWLVNKKNHLNYQMKRNKLNKNKLQLNNINRKENHKNQPKMLPMQNLYQKDKLN